MMPQVTNRGRQDRREAVNQTATMPIDCVAARQEVEAEATADNMHQMH
jgi:hypothetical protein